MPLRLIWVTLTSGAIVVVSCFSLVVVVFLYSARHFTSFLVRADFFSSSRPQGIFIEIVVGSSLSAPTNVFSTRTSFRFLLSSSRP
jgi:hypothetical protein